LTDRDASSRHTLPELPSDCLCQEGGDDLATFQLSTTGASTEVLDTYGNAQGKGYRVVGSDAGPAHSFEATPVNSTLQQFVCEDLEWTE